MTTAIATNLLAPAAALIVWTIVMLLWTMVKRFPAVNEAQIDISVHVGGRGVDLEKLLPKEVSWPSHNYSHLMEQPTIFYPTIIILALLGQGSPVNLYLAWGYVGLRVLHSIWQATINTIPVRSMLFALSTFVLIALAINALRAAIAV